MQALKNCFPNVAEKCFYFPDQKRQQNIRRALPMHTHVSAHIGLYLTFFNITGHQIQNMCYAYRGLVTPSMSLYKLVIIGSGNGLAPIQRQAIIGTKADLLPISEKLRNKLQWISTQNTTLFKSFKKIHLKCRLQRGDHLPRSQYVKTLTYLIHFNLSSHGSHAN